MSGQRRIRWIPAWDKRDPDPRKNYGVSGVNLFFEWIEPDWAISLVVKTPWVLAETEKWWDTLPPRPPKAVPDAEVHRRNGTGEFVVKAGDCPIFPNDPCEKVPLSAFAGERLFRVFVESGEEPFWQEMALALNGIKVREGAEEEVSA